MDEELGKALVPKKRKNWESACRMPTSAKMLKECGKRGFLPEGFGGLDDLGAVDSYAAPESGPLQRKKATAKMGPTRSQLLTWPAVCGPDKAATRKIENIPKKCLGCYAFRSGRYETKEVENAQHRRWDWFDRQPEKEVVEGLVAAIKISGVDKCTYGRAKKSDPWTCKTNKRGKKVCSREDPVSCKTTVSGMPTHFRLFDSGDFHDARAVRIWRAVARKFPRVKFWAPTTAWVKKGLPGEKELHTELGRLAKMKNVTLRPSALRLDKPAPNVTLGGRKLAGSGIVSWEAEKAVSRCPWEDKPTKEKCKRSLRRIPGATTLSGKPVIYDPDDDASRPERIRVRGKIHRLCPGDCAKCWACWNKRERVVYVQHGPDAKQKEKMLARGRSMLEYMKLLFPQYGDIGPEGAEHPAQRFLRARKK